MHGILSHGSTSAHWTAVAAPMFAVTRPGMLSWNWNDQRVIDALDALEHTRFGSDQELRSILAVILSTSNINTVQQDMK